MKKKRIKRKAIYLIIILLLIVSCLLLNKKYNFVSKIKDEVNDIKESLDKIKNPAKEILNEEDVKSRQSLDLETTSGVVLVGSIKKDSEGWYFLSEVPLNITLTYYVDYPEEFNNVIKLRMLDENEDNFNKTIYNNEIVMVYGEVLNPRSMEHYIYIHII